MINEKTIKSIDRSNMWELLCSIPMHWSEAELLVQEASPLPPKDIRNVCYLGMGGSALAGDLFQGYTYDRLKIPMTVVKNYNIPGWVDEHTLLIVSSYSGNTEETLEAMHAGLQAGVVPAVITSGGKLLDLCQSEHIPVVDIPGEIPPRAALAYTFVPIYRFCEQMGLLKDNYNAEMESMTEFLSEQIELYGDYNFNRALDLAENLDDTLPLIYSDSSILRGVNFRWRQQFMENAKTLAYGNFFPEMTHNEIVGWDQIAHLTGRLSVLILRDAEDSNRVSRRMSITRELIENQAAVFYELKSEGENRLQRMFSLIELGDFTSYYLALIRGVDPTPLTKTDLLKIRLAEE